MPSHKVYVVRVELVGAGRFPHLPSAETIAQAVQEECRYYVERGQRPADAGRLIVSATKYEPMRRRP